MSIESAFETTGTPTVLNATLGTMLESSKNKLFELANKVLDANVLLPVLFLLTGVHLWRNRKRQPKNSRSQA